ncbi:MAG: inositol 2-dehydrogenase [Dictyoglomaceae bacterium]|nr:inositol 2-dehydrogenase [Dictyoglomaceae bacterium]
MEKIGVALLGAGRMGQEHAKNLSSLPNVKVVVVADPVLESAEKAQFFAKAEKITDDPESAILDPNVEAVIIVTPTNTHAHYIKLSAKHKKAIFCEKPVALGLLETKEAMKIVEEMNVPFQIGFQRRYDLSYLKAKELIEEGKLGRLEQFSSLTRDPAPPSLEYLKVSGGIFVDMAIHDFDVARFLVGEVEEVMAWVNVLIDPRIEELEDGDTAITFLKFKNGALGVVENSRRAVYGYDIRAEVHGEKGKIVLEDLPKTHIWYFTEKGYYADQYYFFMDRFKDAYKLEIEAFFKAISEGKMPSPGPKDALESLKVSIAAKRSFKEKRSVKVEEMK